MTLYRKKPILEFKIKEVFVITKVFEEKPIYDAFNSKLDISVLGGRLK